MTDPLTPDAPKDAALTRLSELEPIIQELVEGSKRGHMLDCRAYYYGFNQTGCKAIDDILEQVCAAGKSFHHTDQWSDEQDFLDGKSWIDKIQEAADIAANRIAKIGEIK